MDDAAGVTAELVRRQSAHLLERGRAKRDSVLLPVAFCVRQQVLWRKLERLKQTATYGGSCLRLFDCQCAGTCHVRVCIATSVSGVTCGIRLAHWPKRKDDFLAPCRKIMLYVSFFNKAHSGSSRPVAYLKGARLERNNG